MPSLGRRAKVLRLVWTLDDPAQVERRLCNLARRLEDDAPNGSRTILAYLDAILTLVRLGRLAVLDSRGRRSNCRIAQQVTRPGPPRNGAGDFILQLEI